MNTFLKVTKLNFSTAVIVNRVKRKVWGAVFGTPHGRKLTPWMFLEGTLAIDIKHLNLFL